MTFCKVNDCSRTVTFKAEVDSGFCVEHLDIHLGDLRTQAEIATKLVERLRNCFVCIDCGRCAADEDACCATCGRDCMAFEDGKLVRKIVDHVDAIERAHNRMRPVYEAALEWRRVESTDVPGESIAELEASIPAAQRRSMVALTKWRSIVDAALAAQKERSHE